MTTPDFIIALFYAVDQEMLEVPKHPDAKLYPSEVVTLALLHAIKGGGTRAFYRWLRRDFWRFFRTSRSVRAWPDSSRPTRHGPRAFWRRRRCSVSLTATASSCSTPRGKAAAPP